MRSEKLRVVVLIVTMVLSAVLVESVACILLYQTSYEEQKARLVETAQSQARLIEAMARLDEKQTHNSPHRLLELTLERLIDAHKHYEGFGKTGEFTLGKKEKNNIVFLLSHRHFDLDKPKPVPFSSKLAEPMRRALSGLSGTVAGLDYRGVTVLAAHEPIDILHLGIVAKIDLSEIRAPFIRAILISSAIGFLVIAFGTVLQIKVTTPMVSDLWNQTKALKSTNKKLNKEIEYRLKVENELKLTQNELEERVEERTLQLSASNEELTNEIENRKKAQETLDAYERIVSTTPDHIALIDICYIYQIVNDAYGKLYGKRRQDIIGRSVADILGEASFENTVKAKLQQCMAGRVVRFESWFQSNHPDQKYMSVTFFPYRTPEGEVTGVVISTRDITEQKKIQEKLETSEARLADAQHIAKIGNWEWDLETDELFWSDEICNIFGVDPEYFDASYEAFLGFVHPEDKNVVDNAVQDAIANHKIYSIDHRVTRMDHTELYVHEHAEVVTDDQGNAVKMIGTVQDISKRKQLEFNLIESEKRYRTLFEQAPVGIGIAGFDGEILDANQMMIELFGYSLGKMKAMTADQLYENPSFRFEVKEILQRKGAIRDKAVKLKHKSGKIIDALMNIDTISLDGQTLLFTSLRDITELMKANEKIAEMAQFTEKNPAPVLSVDRTGNVLSANQAAYKYFDTEQLVGKKWSSLCPDHDEINLKRLLENGVETSQEECLIGGNFLIFTYKGFREQQYIYIYGADVTHRKGLEDQLRQSQKMEAIGQLAGGIAHDFNTLLGIIIGYAQMLKKQFPEEDPKIEDLEEILDAADRSKTLIKQLMNYSRPGSEDFRQVVVNQVIEQTVNLLRASLPAIYKIVPKICEEAVVVIADPIQLQQVFMNLGINAGDAIGGKGGQIEIVVETVKIDHVTKQMQHAHQDDFILVSITDSGRGMSRETLEHIFEPFFTTKDVGKGTGLGLAVVHGIVKNHKGFIEVKTKPGVGSTFAVYLPLFNKKKAL